MMLGKKMWVNFWSVVLGVCALCLPATLPGQTVGQEPAADNAASALALPLYLKVQLDPKVELSHLKPGDVVEGRLSRGVYRGTQELFPAGTLAHLTVDKLQRRRRSPNDHWPWAVKVFMPRHETYPAFRSASVQFPDGSTARLRVSVISTAHEVEVHSTTAKGKKSPRVAQGGDAADAPVAQAQAHPAKDATRRRSSGRTLALQAAFINQAEQVAAQPGEDTPSPSVKTSSVTLPAGTQARIVLLNGVTASKGHVGDSFRARLIEPVCLGSQVVLPEGSILEGKIVKDTRPRMLSRAGALLLSFNWLRTPAGANAPVTASIYGIDLDRSSHTRVDAEGELSGDRPGKAWMLANIGVTGGISKVADDGTQLLIESLVSTATDASTAGAARIVSSCVGGIFMLTRHGRDVVLPKFTEMSIVFNRPVLIAGRESKASATQRSSPHSPKDSPAIRALGSM
jgi:hypothetical protein